MKTTWWLVRTDRGLYAIRAGSGDEALNAFITPLSVSAVTDVHALLGVIFGEFEDVGLMEPLLLRDILKESYMAQEGLICDKVNTLW